MKKHLLLVVGVLAFPPALWAQTKPAPRTSAHVDPCAPIGRTADGKLIYSMKCENMPAPPPAPVAAAVAPEPPEQRGLLGFRQPPRDPDEIERPPAMRW